MEFAKNEILEFINSEVPTYQRSILIQSLDSDSTSMDFYNQIGKTLTGENNNDFLLLNTGANINKTSFWEIIMKEVFIFICTKEKKYSKERDSLGKNFKEVIVIVSTAIAASFSVGVGVIVGIVTNILIATIKIGKSSWCEYQKAKIATN